MEKYQALAQFKKVTAPYDGVVTVRDIDIGNLVTAGSTSATDAAVCHDAERPDALLRRCAAERGGRSDQQQRPRAHRDQRAGVTRDYDGKVTRTSQSLNPQARTLRVEMDIPNPKDEFVPGMYVKVGFGLPPRGLVQVPAAALTFRASGPQVARVDPSGRISFRNVTIGRDDGSLVELSSGIAPGDRVALNVSSQITDGELVRARGLEADKAAAPVAAAER